MQVTNLNISKEEQEAIFNRQFFLLKDSATKKIVSLFGELEKAYQEKFSASNLFSAGLNFKAGKIFRGENYLLFPYIVLDYPRLFSSSSICAFRTMFWWGHEFSFTLHLQGEALDQFRPRILDNRDQLNGKDVFFCISNSPWDYHFQNNNYLPWDGNDRRDEIMNKPFLKLSRKLPVNQYEKVGSEALKSFELFLQLLD